MKTSVAHLSICQAHSGVWQCLEQAVRELDQQSERLINLWLVRPAGAIQDSRVPRTEFLQVLEWWCATSGWEVAYESVADESCAIFYQGQRDPVSKR